MNGTGFFSFLGTILKWFSPNVVLSRSATQFMVFSQIAFAIGAWVLWSQSSPIIPNPLEIAGAIKKLWFEEGLGHELFTSYGTNAKALFYSVVISLSFAYLTVTPFFQKVSMLLSKFRFLGLAGLTFIFTLVIGGGEDLKIALLTFGMTVFFLTSMAEEVARIPEEEFDHGRTLRWGEWRVVWEVVVLGKMDKAIEVMRQNAAIGWTMLTMVEGIVRSEGGIGGLLLTQNKHFHLAEVFAIQILILVVGMLQDYGIGFSKKKICPWADLGLERKS